MEKKKEEYLWRIRIFLICSKRESIIIFDVEEGWDILKGGEKIYEEELEVLSDKGIEKLVEAIEWVGEQVFLIKTGMNLLFSELFIVDT